MRLGLKALLLGYADLQALRCDGHRQDQEALVARPYVKGFGTRAKYEACCKQGKREVFDTSLCSSYI